MDFTSLDKLFLWITVARVYRMLDLENAFENPETQIREETEPSELTNIIQS